MGTIIATYSDSDKTFYRLARKLELTADGIRRIRASPLRYCLGDKYLYLPSSQADSSTGHLCWARISSALLDDYSFQFVDGVEGYGKRVTTLADLEDAGVRIGDRYLRRWREEDGRFVPVPEFCSQTLIDALSENPETLEMIDNADFENLCAEIFARRGFKVDLFRRSGDGGIDFLAVQDERNDPILFAVQVKQPESRVGRKRRSVGRPVVQQIYGAAKAWDINGGIVISGSTYSAQAKAFAELKPSEMNIYNGRDVLNWIMRYRWNEDELL